jgi:hypothetical protein
MWVPHTCLLCGMFIVCHSISKCRSRFVSTPSFLGGLRFYFQPGRLAVLTEAVYIFLQFVQSVVGIVHLNRS